MAERGGVNEVGGFKTYVAGVGEPPGTQSEGSRAVDKSKVREKMAGRISFTTSGVGGV